MQNQQQMFQNQIGQMANGQDESRQRREDAEREMNALKNELEEKRKIER